VPVPVALPLLQLLLCGLVLAMVYPKRIVSRLRFDCIKYLCKRAFFVEWVIVGKYPLALALRQAATKRNVVNFRINSVLVIPLWLNP
jgi:hypothetical protein